MAAQSAAAQQAMPTNTMVSAIEHEVWHHTHDSHFLFTAESSHAPTIVAVGARG